MLRTRYLVKAIKTATQLRTNYAYSGRKILTTSVVSPSPSLVQKLHEHTVSSNRHTKELSSVEFMNLVSFLSRFSQGELIKVLQSKSHREMYQVLTEVASNLASGRFITKVGISSLTLIGPRGIGKTTSLKNAANAIPVVYPNLITIYVSYVDNLSNLYTQKESILSIVCDQLTEVHNIPVEKNVIDKLYSVREALVRADKFLLILVDEMDKLYEVSPMYHWVHTLTTSLGELAKIGDDNSGRVAGVLCGSSSRLMSLVTANGKKEPECVEQFPLIKLAPNLNGHKYRQRRIYAAPPTDLNTVSNLISGKDVTPENIKAVRAVGFVTGCVAREIDHLKLPVESDAFIRAFNVELSEAAFVTLAKHGPLWREILELLYHKNISLMKQLINTDGTIDMMKVMEVNWEDQLLPISFEEVRASWNMKHPETENLPHWIYYLYDRNYISVSGMKDGRPDLIYPYSLYMLARHPMDEKTMNRTVSQIIQTFRSLQPHLIDMTKEAAKIDMASALQ